MHGQVPTTSGTTCHSWLWRHVRAVRSSLGVVVILSVVILLLRLGGDNCTAVVILSVVVLLLRLGGDKCTAMVILLLMVLPLRLGRDKCTAVVILSVVVLLPRLGRDKCADVAIWSVRVCLVKWASMLTPSGLPSLGRISHFIASGIVCIRSRPLPGLRLLGLGEVSGQDTA